ncbi:helix-turn-helix domain-containing protein [Nocardia sp. NBC_01503]|uniref:helix-turn-helix domain-containing protein n=1 Tax=Nocardia sp. NBC_01503 TaxID=2975997 RepID=UPI002E7AF12C|nr:helix-turn-helix transcriptional regulator [Nocardia sp. NBC_01503]WTL32962.1 helix-turn-helix domain-containing protein [Nocardia sp. NBC_01503]
MAVSSKTSVSRMDFGNFMERLRKRAGKNATAAGLHLGEVSRFVIGRLEEGVPTKLTTPQVESLLWFYRATDNEREEALALWADIKRQEKVARAEGGVGKGFWTEYTDQIAPNFSKFLRLEELANRMVAYHPVIFPGLLQGPDYRRSIIKIDNPELSAVDVERRLELTALRQNRLGEKGFRVEVLVSEAAVRNQVGRPDIMAAQLEWLTSWSEHENVSLRLIEFKEIAHRGLTIQPFTRLEFAPGLSGLTKPPVVYVEGAFSIGYHERDDVIDKYDTAISTMRGVALTEEGTRELLARMMKEYKA